MDVLITIGMTLPEVTAAQLERIQAAAGKDATITLATNREETLRAAPTADVLLGFLDEEMYAQMERLGWVHAIASGVDHYLFDDFKNSEALLTGEKGLVGGHLADHAFALLLALTRRLGAALRAGADSWQHRMEYRREEIELAGLTMGMVGFGGTGREVAKRAVAFGMQCRAVDREAVQGTAEVVSVKTMSGFERMLGLSDVVTVCCPLTSETHHLFNDETLAMMKPTALLINVTRGEIIDGDALVRALEKGTIAGAGLDVAPEEPLPAEHPLWSIANVVMTPHTAGASQLRAGRNIDRFCENLRRFRRGQPLVGVIDKELGY